MSDAPDRPNRRLRRTRPKRHSGNGFGGSSPGPLSSRHSMRARSTRSWIVTAAVPCCCPRHKARCTIRVASCSVRSTRCPAKYACSTRAAWSSWPTRRGASSGTEHARAGLDVRAGENIFAACRDAPESERVYAAAMTEGLRQVLDAHAPIGDLPICLPMLPRGRSVFTFTMAAICRRRTR